MTQVAKQPKWMSAPVVSQPTAKWQSAPVVEPPGNMGPFSDEPSHEEMPPPTGAVEAQSPAPVSRPDVLNDPVYQARNRIAWEQRQARESAMQGPQPSALEPGQINPTEPRSEFAEGFKRSAINIVPPMLRPDPREGTPARGAAGMAGSALGGVVAMGNITDPINVGGFIAGQGAGKLIAGPIIERVAPKIGPVAARMLESAIEGGAVTGSFGAAEQASREDWESDPWGAFGRTVAAGGMAAGPGGILGAGMAGAGELPNLRRATPEAAPDTFTPDVQQAYGTRPPPEPVQNRYTDATRTGEPMPVEAATKPTGEPVPHEAMAQWEQPRTQPEPSKAVESAPEAQPKAEPQTRQAYYHGTMSDFAEFDPSTFNSRTKGEPGSRDAFFFTKSRDSAEAYAYDGATGRQGRIIEADLEYSNPMRLEKSPTSSDIAKAKAGGYDAIETPYEVAVFDPKQIKQRNQPSSTPEPAATKAGAGKQQTWDEYRKERGVERPHVDHSTLSPNGRVSERQRQGTRERFNETSKAYDKAQAEYQAEVDAGRITDPSGEFTPTDTVSPKIAVLENRIADWERIGKNKNGKIVPKYQRATDGARAEIAALEASRSKEPPHEVQVPAQGKEGIQGPGEARAVPAPRQEGGVSEGGGEVAKPDPLKMKLADLRAELEAAGVAIEGKATKKQMAEAVRQVRSGSTGDAAQPAVGTIVKFRIPHATEPSGTTGRAGTVKAHMPDGRIEIKGQDGGLYRLRPDELVHTPESPSFPTAEELKARIGPEETAKREADLKKIVDESAAEQTEKSKDASPILATESAKGMEWEYRVGRGKSGDGKPGYFVEIRRKGGSTWERADAAPWRGKKDDAIKQWAARHDFEGNEDVKWEFSHPELKKAQAERTARYAKMAEERASELKREQDQAARNEAARAHTEKEVEATKWKRGEFTVHINPNHPEAATLPKTQTGTLHAGLAISKVGPGDYKITHAASGKGIASLETLAKAKAFVVRLRGLTDWTKPEVDVMKAVDQNTYSTVIRPLIQDPYTSVVRLGLPDEPAPAPKAAGKSGEVKPDIEARAKAIADAAMERVKKRSIPRGERSGATTLFDDIVDVGIAVSARIVQVGAKTAKRVKKATEKVLAELGRQDLSKHTADIMRVARRIARHSKDDTGTFTMDKMESAVAAMQERKGQDQPTIKQTIAESTGAGRKQPKTLSESEALVRGLRREAKAAKTAYVQGLAEGMNRLDVMKQDLQRAVRTGQIKAGMTERAKGQIALEGQRAKFEGIQKFQDEALQLVNNHVPKKLRGELLNAVQNATTPRGLFDVATRIKGVLADEQVRVSIKDFSTAVKGANSKQMLEQYRLVVRQAVKLGKALRTQANSAGLSLAEKQSIAAEFKELRNQVIEARHRQKADNLITVQGKVAKREAVVAEGVKSIEKRPEIPEAKGLSEERRAGLLGRARQAMWTPDTVGAATGDGTLRRILADEMWEGEDLVNGAAQKGSEFLRKAMEDAGFKWGSDRLQRLSRAASGKEAQSVTINLHSGQELKATPGELMALYATITDGGAGPNISKGAGITFGRDRRGTPLKLDQGDFIKVKLALDSIDPALAKVVEKAKQYVENEVRPGLFEAFREQKGYDLEPVEGYWRTRRNRDNPEAPGLIQPMRKHFNQALENLGFLKERSPETKTPYLIGDFFQDFHDINYQGAVVTHMTKRVRNAELVFGDKRMTAAIQSRFGEGMNKRIERAIDNGKLIFVEPKTGLERAVSVFNRNFARAVLTISPKTWLKQLGGVSKLFGVMDTADAMHGITHAYGKETTAILHSHPFFKNRYEDAVWRRMTPALGERTPLLGPSGVKDSAKRLGSRQAFGAMEDLIDRIEILNAFDAVSSRVAIAGKLAEGKRLGLSGSTLDKWAGDEAAKSIRRTNNTSSVLDMSDVAAQHRGDFASSLLMFTSDSNKSYNMLATGMAEGGKSAAKATTAITINNAFAAAVDAAFKVGIPVAAAALLSSGKPQTKKQAKDDSKRKGFIEAFTRSFLSNTAGMVYRGDEIAQIAAGMYDAAIGRPVMDIKTLDTPLSGWAEDVAKGLIELGRGIGADGKLKSGPNKNQDKQAVYLRRALDQLVDPVSKAAGIPVGPVYRIGQDIYRSVNR